MHIFPFLCGEDRECIIQKSESKQKDNLDFL